MHLLLIIVSKLSVNCNEVRVFVAQRRPRNHGRYHSSTHPVRLWCHWARTRKRWRFIDFNFLFSPKLSCFNILLGGFLYLLASPLRFLLFFGVSSSTILICNSIFQFFSINMPLPLNCHLYVCTLRKWIPLCHSQSYCHRMHQVSAPRTPTHPILCSSSFQETHSWSRSPISRSTTNGERQRGLVKAMMMAMMIMMTPQRASTSF